MSYTPPLGNAAGVSWLGDPPYVPPAGDAADATFAQDVSGVGTAVLVISAEAVGFHGGSTQGVGDGTIGLSATATGVHAIGGAGSAVLGLSAAGVGAHGVGGTAAGSIALTGAGAAVHPRYELRGVVKVGDTLVNRRVRAYNRASGELVAQADTTAGAFAIPAGFAEDEFYVTPIDLDDAAVDWKPPTANRVLSVLAEDTA